MYLTSVIVVLTTKENYSEYVALLQLVPLASLATPTANIKSWKVKSQYLIII